MVVVRVASDRTRPRSLTTGIRRYSIESTARERRATPSGMTFVPPECGGSNGPSETLPTVGPASICHGVRLC